MILEPRRFNRSSFGKWASESSPRSVTVAAHKPESVRCAPLRSIDVQIGHRSQRIQPDVGNLVAAHRNAGEFRKRGQSLESAVRKQRVPDIDRLNRKTRKVHQSRIRNLGAPSIQYLEVLPRLHRRQRFIAKKLSVIKIHFGNIRELFQMLKTGVRDSGVREVELRIVGIRPNSSRSESMIQLSRKLTSVICPCASRFTAPPLSSSQ